MSFPGRAYTLRRTNGVCVWCLSVRLLKISEVDTWMLQAVFHFLDQNQVYHENNCLMPLQLIHRKLFVGIMAKSHHVAPFFPPFFNLQSVWLGSEPFKSHLRSGAHWVKGLSAGESTSILPAVRKAWCWWLGGRAGSSWGSPPPPTSWSPRGSSPSPGWKGSSSARCLRSLQWSWRSQRNPPGSGGGGGSRDI